MSLRSSDAQRVVPTIVFHADRDTTVHPKALLAGYTGILQCDGCTAHKSLAVANGAIALAFCWSHTIRTQSAITGALGLASGWLTSERNDMLDLQCVVMDDDALDDQPENGLALAGIGDFQPRADARTERGKARQRLARLQPLLA